MRHFRLVTLLLCLKYAYPTDPGGAAPCVMELECDECLPEHMPLVTSHRAANGTVRVPAGDHVTLWCGGGHFLAYPLRAELRAACEAGRYRVRADGRPELRHLLDLGCQESIFEDVLHQVDSCAPPLQGRAYRLREGGGGVRHVAVACFDPDRAVTTWLRASNAPANRLALPPHEDVAAPLSLLGNFNHMFDATTRHDAERLYSDDGRLNRRLHELLRHDRYTFAGQTLTSARLLGGEYLEDQNSRVAEFVSNRVAVWGSVAAGNLRHVQRDVAGLLRRARAAGVQLDVWAGTHGVTSLRAGAGRTPLLLRGARFPAPRYVWTVVHAPAARRALALVVLGEPFVAVSEIRHAVFCESACRQAAWLHELHRHRNYEVPLYGLVFCCSLHNFTRVVPEMPPGLDVLPGAEGMLTDLVF